MAITVTFGSLALLYGGIYLYLQPWKKRYPKLPMQTPYLPESVESYDIRVSGHGSMAQAVAFLAAQAERDND